jgi:hypothetical protein
MSSFKSKKIKKSVNVWKVLVTLVMLIGLSVHSHAQSPKKYLKNGFYEQAFVEAAYKQNKKVKLKKKFTEVIYESYGVIFSRHSAVILSEETDWQTSFNKFVRMTNFLAKVKHPGVLNNLANIEDDHAVLNKLAPKFNDVNMEDLKIASNYESVAEYEKALNLYKGIASRHQQVERTPSLKAKLLLIDVESKIEHTNQKIGDKYIQEAQELVDGQKQQGAYAAIDLIELARLYRELSIEEEELLKLANLIIGDSWIMEADKLLKTGTKRNARLAFELINRARSHRALTVEEEKLLEQAEDNGMTRILLEIKGKESFSNAQSFSGILNKKKNDRWVEYYYSAEAEKLDFVMEVSENKPTVELGKIQKKIAQNTETVEYWEDETDAEGNTTSVKKTRQAVAIVATVSRTKTARLDWAFVVKDVEANKSLFSETRETKHELKKEYASLVSGDALGMPEDTRSDVDLDSQPFPSDADMINQIKEMYLKELLEEVNTRSHILRNENIDISE